MAPDCTDGFEWDAAKCARNLARHGIDFADAIAIWRGPVLQRPSHREGEVRFIAFGLVQGRMFAVVWTPRAGRRRIISARMANRHERSHCEALLGRSPRRTD
jgi:uncharacterized protein